MIIKLGRSGNFLSCSNFPECNGSRLIDGNELKPEAPVGTDPDTGLPVFVLKGKFGPYVQLGETPEKVKGKKVKAPRRSSYQPESNLKKLP